MRRCLAAARSLSLALSLLWVWPAAGQTTADTDESAYTASTLAKILGGTARSQNDEAELAPAGAWFHTTATFTGRRRPASGRQRPLISAWVASRGEPSHHVDLYFSADLPEIEFQQAGRKYWVMAGLPDGLGFDVHPAGQELTIYLQRVGFSSGMPVAMLRMARAPAGAHAAPRRALRQSRIGEGARRQEATYATGSATFNYAGRDYTLPLDVAGRHSVAPGLYCYENGVRTALLEFGAGDDRYLLLRVPVPQGGKAGQGGEDGGSGGVVPYLVLGGRIVPPIDVGACDVTIGRVERNGADGAIDCTAAPRAVLRSLTFHAR